MVNKLSTVRVGENESIESAMKRFKRKCQKDGIIGDLRKKEQAQFTIRFNKLFGIKLVYFSAFYVNCAFL